MMDPAKLKVVELRAQLSKRSLDTKGNKPVLVERLRKALEDESREAAKDNAPQVDSRNENVAESTGQKEVKGRSPEPSTPSKLTGRSSRSSSATTPTKVSPVKAAPKMTLTPIAEKQISPAKSPTVDKVGRGSESSQTPIQEPAKVVKVVADEPLKTAEEPGQNIDPGETAEETCKKISDSVEEEKMLAKTVDAPGEESIGEEKAAGEKSIGSEDAARGESIQNEEATCEKTVENKIDQVCVLEKEEKIEEQLTVVQKAAEEIAEEVTEEIAKDATEEIAKEATEEIAAEEHVEDNQQKDETLEKSIKDTSNTDVNDIPDNIESGTKLPIEETTESFQDIARNDDNAENSEETMPEVNKEPEDDTAEMTVCETEIKEEDVKMSETDDVSSALKVEETAEEKPDISPEQEGIDSTVENAVQQSQEQVAQVDVEMREPKVETEDVEMKEPKVEAEEDSSVDTKDRVDKKDRKDRKRKRSSSPLEEKCRSPPPQGFPCDEPDLKEAEVVLSWYDSDLNLMINKESFVSATAMYNEGFGYIWAGARASYGFTEGKVYFETKIIEYCVVDLPDEQSPHVLRVGWSVQGTSMQLGEEPLTYGFGGTGKASSGNKFSDYGEPFGKDDIVGCYLDLTDDSRITISYTINGKDMGTAFSVDKRDLAGKPLYPHALTKNCTFVCNFGQEAPWSTNVLDGYVPVGSVDLKNRVQGPRRPERKEDCEMIMMCGLPAAGKTVWAANYSRSNPDKMYNILGTNILIDKMKVIGLPRKRNYHGRWESLIQMCTRCLNKLLEIASTRRRNYILDQTNVYPTAQRRKMRNFFGFQRRAIVIVPTDEEWKARTVKRTAAEGEVIPEPNVLEMKANFSPPVVGDTFDSVEWVELSAEEGKKLIEKYNKEGKEAGYGQQQANKRPRVEKSDNHRDNREASRQNSRDSRESRDSRDSRDHRDRRNNYSDRSRNSSWRGGSNSNSGSSGSWKDRQQPRAASGSHVRHGHGYGGPSNAGWRGRSSGPLPPPSPYRASNDRRASSSGHDRRTSGSDRNRAASSRTGGWGAMSSYQNSQPSGNWGGGTGANWHGSQSQSQSSWGSGHSAGWNMQHQQQQQWGNWKGYTQNYGQGSYGHQGYGNGNWGSWNQQYYNQYWGQQQPTGQTSAAGSQAVSKQ